MTGLIDYLTHNCCAGSPDPACSPTSPDCAC